MVGSTEHQIFPACSALNMNITVKRLDRKRVSEQTQLKVQDIHSTSYDCAVIISDHFSDLFLHNYRWGVWIHIPPLKSRGLVWTNPVRWFGHPLQILGGGG